MNRANKKPATLSWFFRIFCCVGVGYLLSRYISVMLPFAVLPLKTHESGLLGKFFVEIARRVNTFATLEIRFNM